MNVAKVLDKAHRIEVMKIPSPLIDNITEFFAYSP
jgi:hypothetical protein